MDYNYAFYALMRASILIISISAGIALVFYLLRAFGLFKIAQKQGQSYPWLAFIPVFNMYLLGKTVFEKAWQAWTLFALDAIYILVPALGASLISPVELPILSYVLMAALLIFYFVALYKLYDKLSDKAVLMLIFTVITLGFIAPIFIFAIRNNELKDNSVKNNSTVATHA